MKSHALESSVVVLVIVGLVMILLNLNLRANHGLATQQASSEPRNLQLEYCEVTPLRSGAFLITVHDGEKTTFAHSKGFADGLEALERSGYEVVMQLPSDDLPKNAIAVWARKKVQ
jgi:hypothetical protein